MNYNKIDPHGTFLYSDSRLNVIVSAYEHNNAPPWMYRDGTPFWWSLGDLLLEHPPQKYIDLQNRIRSAPDEATQKALKGRAFGFTPSGYFGAPYGKSFTGRTAENLQHHTGLIWLDFDGKDSTGENVNFQDAINVLSKWPCIAYVGISIRGMGFHAGVAVPRHSAAQMHEAHAKALILDLQPHFGQHLDTACTDVTRLRYYSWTDPADAYVNHYPEDYERFYIPAPAPKPRPKAYAAPRERIGETSAKTSEVFNSLYKPIDILTAHGWKVKRTSPTQTHLTRPEAKTNGNDATIYHDVEKVKVFSTSAGIKTKGEHCAFGLFALLEHAGDWTEAAKAFWNTHNVGAR